MHNFSVFIFTFWVLQNMLFRLAIVSFYKCLFLVSRLLSDPGQCFALDPPFWIRRENKAHIFIYIYFSFFQRELDNRCIGQCLYVYTRRNPSRLRCFECATGREKKILPPTRFWGELRGNAHTGTAAMPGWLFSAAVTPSPRTQTHPIHIPNLPEHHS